MPYTPHVWVDEILAAVERYTIKENGGTIFKDDMQIILKTAVTTPGSPLTAGWMNAIELWLTASREVLTADRTYYVRTDGSNSNTGLANTAGGAFLTLQKAYDVIKATLDTAGYAVTIQVGAGTYAAGLAISQPWTGGGLINLKGDETTPANCIISAATAINITSLLPAIFTISGFKLTGATSGIAHAGIGIVQYKAMTFASAGNDITAGSGARVEAIGNYSIETSKQRHLLFSRGAVLILNAFTITHTGTPAYSLSFIDMQQNATARIFAPTFTGAATGKRYNVISNSIIEAGGAAETFLPGDVAGTRASGGKYIGVIDALADNGTWTPTLTNTTNIDSSVAHVCKYIRIGNIVNASGIVEVDATATGSVVLKMSLPIASNFAITEDCDGIVCAQSSANPLVGFIVPDTTTDTLDIRFNALVTTNVSYRFMVMFIIK